MRASVLLAAALSGCAHKMRRVSARPPGPVAATPISQREPPLTPEPSPLSANIYKREMIPTVRVVEAAQRSASLFVASGAASDLFTARSHRRPGDRIRVTLDNIKTPGESGSANPSPNAPSDDDALLQSIPSLARPASDPSQIVRHTTWTVESILPRGDLILSYTKQTQLAGELRTLSARASLPAAAIPLDQTSEVRASQLQDVTFTDIYNTNTLQLESPDWDDAYTLRLSNFHEQNNAYALQLENKRKQMEHVAEQLEQRIRQTNENRRQWTQERTAWQNEQRTRREKQERTEQQLATQEQDLARLRKESEDLKRENAQLKTQLDALPPAPTP